MHDSVLRKFPKFSEGFEGRFLWPYLDWDGLVTVGIGCLIDTIESALALPWKLQDGSLASHDEIFAQWHDLKAQVRLAKVGAKFAESVTQLRLTDADVDALLMKRLLQNERILSGFFVDWQLLPADCQLAIHSMAWAMGANFTAKFPKFVHAVNARDFDTARVECTIANEDKNKGLIPRNAANRICLANAAAVRLDINHAGHGRGTHALSLDQLYWPKALTQTRTTE